MKEEQGLDESSCGSGHEEVGTNNTSNNLLPTDKREVSGQTLFSTAKFVTHHHSDASFCGPAPDICIHRSPPPPLTRLTKCLFNGLVAFWVVTLSPSLKLSFIVSSTTGSAHQWANLLLLLYRSHMSLPSSPKEGGDQLCQIAASLSLVVFLS